ncbi:MAG: hypothetical protein IJU76_12910 [Desulfovibrionaceae bacterium]|nr:hypothetical protein [Desulfovibrionaceae bacterium]
MAQTDLSTTTFSKKTDRYMLHQESVSDGAVLDTGHHFGWNITLMQCGSLSQAV